MTYCTASQWVHMSFVVFLGVSHVIFQFRTLFVACQSEIDTKPAAEVKEVSTESKEICKAVATRQ